MKHLLGIEGLTRADLYRFLDNARGYIEISTRDIKKVPALRGKTIINLFLEPSTRTRTSFEIAGKRLSADTINLSAGSSSVVKGETLLDTARNLEAMAPDILVVRHKASGAPHFLAKHLQKTSVINAGDGMHEHPSQALLDLLTLRERLSERKDGIENLRLAIVGDVLHSRVARSNIYAHLLLGNSVTLVGPPPLVPKELEEACGGKVKVSHSLSEGIEGADVVMCLRMQLERQDGFFVPSVQEYSREFCVSEPLLKRLAPESVVMHPGPLNRGIEISGEVADGSRSLIGSQVTSGVAVRMAALVECASKGGEE